MNQVAPIDEVRRNLAHMESKIAATLPKGMEFDRFARHVMLNIERDPSLLNANRNTLYSAVSQASASGLVPDGKEGVLTTYGNSVVWMPMAAGLLKLANQTGEIKSVSMNVVRADDQFDYWFDDQGEHVMHRPKIGSKAEIVAAYAVITTIKGGVYADVLSAEEINKIRMSSRAGAKGRGPWQEWFEEMAKKSALRRTLKKLPVARENAALGAFLDAAESVDEFYSFGKPEEQPATAGRPRVFDAIQQGETT